MAKAVPVLNTSTGAESESLQVVALSRTRSRVCRGHPPITLTPSGLRWPWVGEMVGYRAAKPVGRFGARPQAATAGRFGTCLTPEPAKRPAFNTAIPAR